MPARSGGRFKLGGTLKPWGGGPCGGIVAGPGTAIFGGWMFCTGGCSCTGGG